MNDIQFVSDTQLAGVWASRHLSSPLAVTALKSKPNERAVELFTTEGRFIVLREASLEAGSDLYKIASSGKEETLILDCRESEEKDLDLIAGLLLASFRFDKYQTKAKAHSLKRLVVLSKAPERLEETFKTSRAEIEGVLYARQLTSEPPNVLYPMAYAERLRELTALGVKVEILDEKALQAIGMTALLAVGQGSCHPSAVAILTWNGLSTASQPICLVGKGVCFDSGGLCLKPGKAQPEMKWDKAGSGVVAGVIKACALAKMAVHVVGIVGLVENMPDGAATKPGDIIKTMSGQTIEIIDTDAEGRLVLADCLWYAAKRFQPKVLLDLGTLTVETFASLGSAYAGLYCNNQELRDSLIAAGKETQDLLWELPMGPFFAKQIESDCADIKNVGVDFLGENGAAAEFLKCFVKDVPWAHIDIAGVSWTKEDLPLCPKGVTGFGVRLLTRWLRGQGSIQ